MKKENEDSARRKFLQFGLLAGGAAAVVGLKNIFLKKTSAGKVENKKIKMLTPDGKLVEVDESVVSQVASDQQRASNKEVQQWMKTSKI
jgi:hypothetical protein